MDCRVSFSQSAVVIDAYDFIEITLEVSGDRSANPFTDVRVMGWFAREGEDNPIRVDGFCDSSDGSVYRIRFMPTALGTYNYGVAFRQGNGVRHEHKGSFDVVYGGRKGLLGVDKENPWHFVWEGTGEHYFYNGTTTYFLMGWDEDNIRRNIERMASLRVNRLRVALCGRVKDGLAWYEPVFPSDSFTFNLNPWIALDPESVDNPCFDVTRFNVPFWQKYEKLLTWARDRDIAVSVVFYVDGARTGTEPFGDTFSEDELRYYRYAAARFSAFSNVTWDISNEYRFFRSDEWAKHIGTHLREWDSYHHITSIHGFEDFRFRTEPWVDFAMYQSWDERGGNEFMLGNRRQQEETGRLIPQVNEEYGYEDHYPVGWGNKRVHPSRDADSRRRIAWEIAMAGCYQTTGEKASTAGGWINGGGDQGMTMLVSYGYMLDFFTDFEWWKANPSNNLIKKYDEADFRTTGYFTSGDEGKAVYRTAQALCLANPGETYAVYLPAGGTVTLELADSPYRVRLYNPRAGEWADLPLADSPEWMSPELPDHGDWAFLLQRPQTV